MNDGNMHKQCRRFNKGNINTHDEDRSGRPTINSEDLSKEVLHY